MKPGHQADADTAQEPPRPDRRTFLGRLTAISVGGTLAAGYGSLAVMAGQYLYPPHGPDKQWLYVRDLASFAPGQSLAYLAPDGAPINITRRGSTGVAADFIALSSTCPHLGCNVHWEPQNNRFFCPCHNGAFDPSGKGIAGPPAGLSLKTYPLQVQNELLFIEVPVVALALRAEAPPQAASIRAPHAAPHAVSNHERTA